MEMFISDSINRLTVPESYVLPPDKRPGYSAVPSLKTIPVIDLGGANCPEYRRPEIIGKISSACQEYGFFQVVNHGLENNLLDEMYGVAKEFFMMPKEDRAKYYSEDYNQVVRAYSSVNKSNEKIHYWRDNFKHIAHPIQDYIHLWPEKPANYREIAARYSVEVRGLAFKLLEMISEALGLESDYFSGDLSRDQKLSINHYPQCPDPSLTLGLPRHCDPNLITILQQGEVTGLQVMKEGSWLAVEPLPNAFVVNIGHQLQIVSNGKLRCVEHRAVTNSIENRTSVATFIGPSKTCIVEPAPSLVNTQERPLYKALKYEDFFQEYARNNADSQIMLQAVQLDS